MPSNPLELRPLSVAFTGSRGVPRQGADSNTRFGVRIFILLDANFFHSQKHWVCLQVGDQVGVKDKGFELLPHRCRSSIYELAVIWELALNEALGMKRIFSIIME